MRRLGFALFVTAISIAPLAHAETFRTEDPDARGEYVTKLSKGESAFTGKDPTNAIAAFKDAIKIAPERMLAYYRLAEVQQSLGKFDEAEATLRDALTKKGVPLLKAKVLFVLATNFERAHIPVADSCGEPSKKLLEGAKVAWTNYLTFVNSNSEAHGYASIAEHHKKVVERRIKDEVDYCAVRERIQRRIKEKEAEAVENAKKDAQNR